jgi:hypothetical protein
MKDHLKAMGAHFHKCAKASEAMASCHKELSEAFKARQNEGLEKASAKDCHGDLASCHADQAKCYKAMGDACIKAAGELPADAKGGSGYASSEQTNLDGDAAAKVSEAIATKVIDQLRREFGEQVVPTLVKGVIPENPIADAGITLHARAGGAAIPTDPSRIDPQFRNLFVE